MKMEDKLLMMAGQIEGYFASYSPDIAVPQVAGHINAFWSRKMRQDFLDAFSADDARLSPLLQQAYALIKPPANTFTNEIHAGSQQQNASN